jgi:uncharacterized membrane protein YciS (DUF1049 family)
LGLKGYVVVVVVVLAVVECSIAIGQGPSEVTFFYMDNFSIIPY